MNKEEGLALVESWRRSGLSVRAFCEANKFSPQRLQYWSTWLERDELAKSRDAFVVLPLDGTHDGENAVAGEADDAIELFVTDTLFVRVPVRAGANVFATTLRALIEVTR